MKYILEIPNEEPTDIVSAIERQWPQVKVSPTWDGEVVGAVEEMDATTYLMSSPANAARLLKSIEQLERGEVVERPLIADDAEPAVSIRQREVWEWKEKAYESIKHLPPEEWAAEIARQVGPIVEELRARRAA